MPPPHPSKFSHKKFDEKAATTRNKNTDLHVEFDDKQNFVTVGRNSNITSNIQGKQLFNETEPSYYPTMSKQSEKIVQYYKTQSEKESRKCLDESYESLKSESNESYKNNNDSLESDPEYIDNFQNRIEPYETARTDGTNEIINYNHNRIKDNR